MKSFMSTSFNCGSVSALGMNVGKTILKLQMKQQKHHHEVGKEYLHNHLSSSLDRTLILYFFDCLLGKLTETEH